MRKTSKENFLKSTPARKAIIIRRNCFSIEDLVDLAKDPAEKVRAAVASKRATPEDILKELSKDDSDEVKAAVAGNTATPADILKELSKDDLFRNSLLDNVATPGEILMELALNPLKVMHMNTLERSKTDYRDSRFVLEKMTIHPNTPPEILDKLSGMMGEEEKISVAEHPNTTSAILKKMAKEDNKYIKLSIFFDIFKLQI